MTSIPVRADQFKKFVYRSIAYPLVLLAFFAAILLWRVIVLMDAAQWVDYSDKVIAQANYTLTLAVDEETGERGYLVNGNTAFLDRYNKALTSIGPALDKLGNMVADNSRQQQGVANIAVQYRIWQNEVDKELNSSRANPDNYRDYFDQSQERVLMDTLRGEFGMLVTNEEHLRDDRENSAEHAMTMTLLSFGMLAVIFGIGLGLIWTKQAQNFANHYEEVLTVSQRNLSLLSATLMSIGDAVLVTDNRGKVVHMNNIAQDLTGWRFADAYGMSADLVFKIIHNSTRNPLPSPIAKVLETGNADVLSDQALLIKQDGNQLSIDDICSPIRNDSGALVGVVLVFRDVTERKRAEHELARLYERERRIAENLQRSLLSKPDPNLFPFLDIETFYQPAWAEAKVGGDYFDIIALDGGKAALIVGDVSGKGLKAASRTAEMKFTLRAYLREDGDIANAISRLNRFVCRSQSSTDHDNGFFLCMTAIVIDPATGCGTACISGTEPALIVRKNGNTDTINACGLPIGAFPESEYESVPVKLEKGDVIVVCTDGITEARHDKVFLGSDGLARLATMHHSKLKLVDVGTSIIDDVREFAENKLSDDVCLLIARQK
jgi:PAS domain S-box-containing protein